MQDVPEPAASEIESEILTVAGEFSAAAKGALDASLHRASEHLVAEHAKWFNSLDPDTIAAMRKAVDETIRSSAAQIGEELKDPDLWLSPSVVLEQREEHFENVYSRNPFVLVPVERKLVSHVEHDMPAGEVDHPFNRVWVHLSNGADNLDGVMKEFGLEPSDTPDWGGGHYGLQPKTVEELDPSGTLKRLWKRYVGLFRKLRGAEEAVPAGYMAASSREEALRRWREA